MNGDGDSFSNYYDCDDTLAAIGPRSPECSGIALIGPAVEDPIDSAGDDGNIAGATPMIASSGDGWELQLRSEMNPNARTIFPSGDVDYFSIIVPAKSAVLVHGALTDMSDAANVNEDVVAEAFDSLGAPVDGPDPLSQNTVSAYDGLLFIPNTTSQAATFYVKFSGDSGTDTGYYVPFYYNIGFDVDGDFFYTQDWPGYRDCNDADGNISPAATDTNIPAPDGIDNNCNGVDGS